MRCMSLIGKALHVNPSTRCACESTASGEVPVHFFPISPGHLVLCSCAGTGRRCWCSCRCRCRLRCHSRRQLVPTVHLTSQPTDIAPHEGVPDKSLKTLRDIAIHFEVEPAGNGRCREPVRSRSQSHLDHREGSHARGNTGRAVWRSRNE